MCGPSPTDIATLRPKLRLPLDYKPIKGWKIAVSMDLGVFEVDPEVRKARPRPRWTCSGDLGATVEEVDLHWPKETLAAGIAYLEHLFGAYLSSLLKDHADEMTSYVRRVRRNGAEIQGRRTSSTALK